MIVLPKTYEHVWSLLQKHCGAGEEPKTEFLQNTPRTIDVHEHMEFRFQGALGFGGKIRYNPKDHFYVDCYPEDMNPERRRMIEEVNAELKKLKIRHNLDLNIDDGQAESCIKTCRWPVFIGKNGLIVVTVDQIGIPKSYWHQGGFVADFSDTSAEYPRLFKTLDAAKKRAEKMGNASVYEAVLAEWMAPDWEIMHPLRTKYSEIGGQWPGSPQQ